MDNTPKARGFVRMKYGSLMLWGITGCWAPEMVQPTTQPSPPKNITEPQNETTTSTQIRPNASQTQSEKQEIQEQARKPPYTAWTMQKEVAILGPNGATIFTIPKRGTRLEVHKIVPQYAQVLCSGCAPPKQNQAGWVNVEEISMEWDMPEQDPLLTMLSLRRKWLKNDDPPKELSDRRAICMLFDNGYEETEDGLLWSIQGGSILFKQNKEKWIVEQVIAPTTPPASSWRCDPPKTPSNQ